MRPLASPLPPRNGRVQGRGQSIQPGAVVVETVVNGGRWLRNGVAGFSAGPDFVHMDIAGRLPEHRTRPQGWRGWLERRLRPRQDSLAVWRERLQWLADDPRLKGVIITIGDLQAELSALESLRRNLLAFRTSGKRLIAHLVTANRTYIIWPVRQIPLWHQKVRK